MGRTNGTNRTHKRLSACMQCKRKRLVFCLRPNTSSQVFCSSTKSFQHKLACTFILVSIVLVFPKTTCEMPRRPGSIFHYEYECRYIFRTRSARPTRTVINKSRNILNYPRNLAENSKVQNSLLNNACEQAHHHGKLRKRLRKLSCACIGLTSDAFRYVHELLTP